MTHVLGAGVLAAFLTVLGGGLFIAFLRDRSLGQNIREEGPAGHRVKQGTPTMGGLLILTMAADRVPDLHRAQRARPSPCSA